MKGLHVRFEGLTASYPYPFLRTGTVLSMPMPPYSSIFGMLSACAGRDIRPDSNWRMGFEFSSGERRTIDIERTDRLKTDNKGRLKRNPEQGIAKREFHVYPRLNVYLNDLTLSSVFRCPVATPCFGRSQDIAWIVAVTEIDLEPVTQGAVRSTLAPYSGSPIGQILPPLVDFYINDLAKHTRLPGRISRYVAIPGPGLLHGFMLASTPQMPLYHPSDSDFQEHAVVLLDFNHE
jgi:CRISPR-associated protein Cas5t